MNGGSVNDGRGNIAIAGWVTLCGMPTRIALRGAAIGHGMAGGLCGSRHTPSVDKEESMSKVKTFLLATVFAFSTAACGTLFGAGVGAGSGAAIAAGTGHNPAKGALLGAGIGGAAGAIYDITR